MKTPDLKKNFLLSTIYQLVLIIVPFLTAPYVSRVLGVTNNGIYSYTTSIQIYFSLLAALGTASYGMREIARNREDRKRRSELFFEIELLSVISSLIMLVAWIFFIFMQKEYQNLYWILTLNLFNTMLDISWFYSGMEQFSYTVTRNTVCKLAGVVLVYLLVKDQNDLSIYTFIMSSTTLLGTASMWISLPKFVDKTKIQFSNLKHHFRQTLIYFLPTIATSIYTVLDKTLIGTLTGDLAENGYYDKATQTIGMVKVLTFSAINAVLGSRMSYLFAQEKIDEIKERLKFSLDYIMFIGIGCAFGIAAIAPKMIPWFFGEEYQNAIILVQLMAPIVVVIGLSNMLETQYYSPAGRRKESTVYVVIGAVLNFILNLLLIPQLKAQGAVIASVIAETCISVLYMHFNHGYLSWRDVFQKCYKRILAGILMLVVVNYLFTLINGNFVGVILGIIIGASVYVITLLLLRDNFEISMIKQVIGRIRK